MNNRTCINIEKKTTEALKEFKITKMETYDEIITRLIKHFKNCKKR